VGRRVRRAAAEWAEWLGSCPLDPADEALLREVRAPYRARVLAEIRSIRGPLARPVTSEPWCGRRVSTSRPAADPLVAPAGPHTVDEVTGSPAPWGDGDVPVPASGVCSAFLDGEAVLYDLADRRAVLLNTTAAAVWAAVDGLANVGEIVAELCSLFAAEALSVRRGCSPHCGRSRRWGFYQVARNSIRCNLSVRGGLATCLMIPIGALWKR